MHHRMQIKMAMYNQLFDLNDGLYINKVWISKLEYYKQFTKINVSIQWFYY